MKFRLISRAALGLSVAFIPALAISAAFTAGDLVVYRVGATGGGSLTNAATAVILDEYSPTGTLVQSIAMPTAASGSNKQCTASGTASSEGLATLSVDGKYLLGTCYAADAGTAAVPSTTSAATPRTVFRADSSGNVDTTTALTDFASGNNPRGAASSNGTDLWVAANGTTSTAGIHYTTFGATTSTQLSTTVTNLRAASIYGGQLYISDASGAAVRIGSVGSGLPTTSGQTIANLPGFPTAGSPYAFVLLNVGGAGIDTLYVADDTSGASGGLLKYSLSGGTWTAKGIIGSGTDTYRGVTGSASGGVVKLYAVRKGGTAGTGGGELVTLTDSSGSGGTISGTPTVIGTAGANNAFRGVAFAPAAAVIPTLTVTAPATITEGNTGTSTATFTVTLDNPAPAGGVNFQIDTANGTATAGSDYVAIVAGNGTIASGQTSTTFGVTINGDTVYEGNETFSVNLSSITNTTNASASANATISEDDPQPTITVGDASVVEGNSGSTVMNFPITLSNASVSDVSFTAQTQNGTATAGSDYDALTTTVTITAGMTTGTIFVGVHGDTTVEPDETFTLTLSNPVNGSLGNTTATGTIQNDDNVTPTFSINDVTHAEGNAGTTNFVFTVSSNVNAPAAGYTLNVDTADSTATAADGDYVGLHTTVTIPSGATSAPVTVVVNGDNKFEADETFGVTLSNQPAGTILGTATGTGTISNDDSTPTLSVANVSVTEGNSGTTNAIFTASLTNPTSSDVTFTISTTNGTASAGSDYVAIVNGTGTITAGSTSTTVNVTVNGDTSVEANETFTLNLSAITNTANATASATGTITNDDFTSIMQIQGHGTASPMAGLSVTTQGVVTALKTNGFFMQDPVGDNDLTTSDGIFVFTSSAPAVQVGDGVKVVGSVQEFGGSTEISGSPTVTLLAHPAPVQPVAYEIASNPPTNDPTTGICVGTGSTIANPPTATDGYQASNFACLDGMLVTMQNAIVTGSTFATGQDGVHTGTPRQTWVKVNDGSPHPFHGVGALYPGLGAGIPVWNGEPEVLQLFYAGLAGFSGPALNDGTTFSVTGVMQGFTATGTTFPVFEIYPATLTTNIVVTATQELQPVPDSAAGTLTIGSQNLLHFFNATADGIEGGYTDTCGNAGGTTPGASDQCPTPTEYDTRLSKWAKQICDMLKQPVVMDLEEIENRSVAHDLATRVGTTCGTSYVPYVIPGNDVSGINIGILVRSDVVVSSVTQMYKNTMTANCSSGTSCLLNDRPPMLMQATWNGYRFALLAIYDRSLSGLGDPTKPYIGPKRAEQAAQIAQIAQAWQSGITLTGAGDAQQDATGTITPGPFNITGDTTVPLIVAGDFNAYEFTDGYADVTGMIKGTAVQSQNLYWYSGNVPDTDTPPYVAPNPTLVDTGDKAGPGQRYSYNFSGMRQEIDHILLSRLAWQDFVSIGNAHGDADVSGGDAVIFDATTPARSGDHDGQVVTIAIDRVFADGYEAQP